MGKLYSFISALLIAVGSLYAAAPSGYEWWIDNDVSQAKSGAFSAGKLDLKIDTSDLPRGSHYFNCRLTTTDGVWGSVYCRMFYSIGKDGGAIGYEYWFDNDHEAKETGTLTQGKKTFSVDVSSLTPGVHYFNCRLNSSETEWGSVYRETIYAVGSSQDVSSYEYWFDNDYDTMGSGNISSGSATFSVNASSLSPGVHYFNCRLCSTDGKWGSVFRQMVFTTPTGIDAAAYEYWIDDKYQSKVEGDISKGSNMYSVGLTGLRRGLHRFNYRIRTGAGVWGSVYSSYFYIDPDSSFDKTLEYWLDDDYAGRQTMTSASNSVSFKLDLSGFDKTALKPHFFNLRVYDKGYPEGSAFYRKLFVPLKGIKAPIIGYRHFVNDTELNYVDVQRQFVDSYLFDVAFPDSVRPTVRTRRPSFDGDKIFIAGADSIDYTIQIRTELGWTPPQMWRIGVSNGFSTTAVGMAINSRHTFAAPTDLEFAAMKFTATGDSLYFRSDIPVALDIYKGGEKVHALTAQQVKGMSMLKLDAGEYFGVLHSVEDAEAKNFTLHLMDTPNQVPIPHIEYKDEMVSISCSRQDAQIRYTLDGKDPDGESTLYTEPFPMKRNGMIKAKAWVEGSDIEPSAVAEYTIDTYKTAAPVAEFDLPKRLLTLTSETKDATIRYTFEYDRTDSLGGVWTDYENPIQIRKNRTVYSRAVFDGYKDSEITVTEITTLPDSVPMPKIEFEKGIVNISCAEKDAEIHYTLDGTRPTGGSTRYEGAFPLRRNATVMAMAFVPGLDIDSSRVATRVVDSYKVATPKGSFDVSTRLLTLTCDTVGASIFHKFDSEGEWTPYSATERIRMRKNGTVYAKATFDGYNDSDVAEIVVSELPNEVAAPVIACDANAVVTISCATDGSVIRYSFDNEQPTMESTLYEKEFTITRNTRVNAFAYVPDLDIEPSAVSSELFDIFTVADLRYSFNSESRELTIECDTKDAKILYTFDPNGEWTEYTAPIRIRKNCTLYAKGVREGYNDSKTETITINSLADSVQVPVISFENGMVDIKCATEKTEIHYTIDDPNLTADSPVFTGPFDLDRNATIRAFALIPGLDIEPSDIVTKVIDSFKAEAPTGSFNAERRELTLSCSTANAKIYYSFVADAQDWTEYTAPISISRNRNVYAKATRDGWNDSDVATIPVNELANSVPVPVISFADGKVEISCTNTSAEIHYTIDDENLTTSSPRYTEPFDLDRNATIRAFALIPGLDIEPSEVETKVIDSFKVATPTGSFNVERRELTLSCSTANAKIYYSFVADTQDWTEYSAPISITRNRNVYAKASREGWNDSDVATIPVTELANSVPVPVISFADGKVEITCTNANAEIHYTVDDPNLTASSTLYTGPFSLDRNATIRAFALIPGLDIEPSEVETLVIDSYKVEDPTGSFNVERRELTLSCGTANSKIYYSFVADTEDWTEYTAPISITRNITVYARATRDGYNDSEIARIPVTELANSVAAPRIQFANGMVTISCDTDEAEIHYTIDDENLTASSPRYTEPFSLDRNATIRAFALIPGLDIDPSDTETYTVESYKVATPYGRFNSDTRTLTILCDTQGVSISYTLEENGEWIPYSEPFTVEGNRTIYAMATRDGWNDSETAEIVISDVKCADVTFGDYKGHYVSLSTSEEGATIRYTTDGSEPSGGQVYTAPFDAEGLCTVRAVAVKSGFMNSEVAEKTLDFYADENHAETSAEGLLASAFEWDDTGLPGSIEDFRVEGRLNEADYEFIRSMAALRHLDLEKVADAHIPANAFSDSRLISISLPEDLTECGDAILSGSGTLSSVIWNSRSMNVGEELTRGLANPNALLYVPAEVSVSGNTGLNVVREDDNPEITLHYGSPYYAARGFRAARVSLTHEFTQTTKPDTCRGWETIVLPFSPTEIRHEVNGPIVPFAAWNEDINGDKPFWLYSATSTGWEEAKSIEACVPYIISMPNNQDYVREFILGGNVTFSAEDVDLGPDSSFADSYGWMEGMRFEGTFMPVEETGVLALNVNSTDGNLQPGSTFVAAVSPVPFGAYVSGAAGRKAIPLFGESTTIGVPMIVDAGLLIETPAPGVLKVCSGRECRVAVTTATGVTIRTLHLKPGEAQTLEGLTRDLYIVAGRKVMVR